jgi:hypothetical protein
MALTNTTGGWMSMCHERWMRRERRRDEEFDQELRYLLDEREETEPPATVAEREPEEQPADPEQVRVEARA